MAKQRGPHQLSGKINNLCYYSQKGVRGGLVRRINDGMSARLKSDEAFAATREANSVFGMCSLFAGQILNLLGSRSTFLFRAARQSILTKAFFEYYRSLYSLGSKQSFVPGKLFSVMLAHSFDRVVKNKLSDFLTDINSAPSFSSDTPPFGVEFTGAELEDLAYRLKCKGFYFSFNGVYQLYVPYYSAESSKYEAGELYQPDGRPYRTTWLVGDGDWSMERTIEIADDCINIAFLTISPIIEQVGGRNVISQGKSICKLIVPLYE